MFAGIVEETLRCASTLSACWAEGEGRVVSGETGRGGGVVRGSGFEQKKTKESSHFVSPR